VTKNKCIKFTFGSRPEPSLLHTSTLITGHSTEGEFAVNITIITVYITNALNLQHCQAIQVTNI